MLGVMILTMMSLRSLRIGELLKAMALTRIGELIEPNSHCFLIGDERIVIFDGWLTCAHRKLTHIRIPSSIISLICSYNNIASLVIPYQCHRLKILRCASNEMGFLSLPGSLTELTEINCSNNKLRSLIVPYGTRSLDCRYNQLETLLLPKSTTSLNGRFNALSKKDYSEHEQEANISLLSLCLSHWISGQQFL